MRSWLELRTFGGSALARTTARDDGARQNRHQPPSHDIYVYPGRMGIGQIWSVWMTYLWVAKAPAHSGQHVVSVR